MKIQSSNLFLNSDRKYNEKDVSKRDVETIEDMSIQSINRESTNKSNNRESINIENKDQIRLNKDQIRLSKDQINLNKDQINLNTYLFSRNTDVPQASSDDDIPADPKLAAMKRMLEAMMGKKLKLTNIAGVQSENVSTGDGTLQPILQINTQNYSNINTQNPSKINTQNPSQPAIPVRRIRITEFNSHYESEATQFNAFGNVKTEDGQSIDFKLHLNMKRQFYAENKFQQTTDAILTDPLVVNFKGTPADLTDVKFNFDLNSDGNDENISWLSSGSGFLVLDKNQDRIVNNGTELFGPATNNGFKELAELDEDQNGWIDENDAAFKELLVWSGDTPETAQLKSLKDSGIGAIGLSSVETEFSLKDDLVKVKDKQNENQLLNTDQLRENTLGTKENTLGQIRRTGIYLEENGKIGTIQQLDLAI